MAALYIRAEEIDTMTTRRLRGIRFIHPSDQENITDERLEKLKHLTRRMDAETQQYAVDAVALNEKLAHVSPRPSPPSSERTTPVPMEELEERYCTCAYEAYNKLMEMGGRPSGPINPNPGSCNPSKSDIDKEHHTLDYLATEKRRAFKELTRWENFCSFRQKPRRSPEAFHKYVERVRKLEQDMAVEWSVQLQLELEEQTKLDEWKEYYIYEYSKKHRMERRLEWAQREMEAAQKKMTEAESNGSTGTVPNTVLSMRAAEVGEYEEKMAEARKVVESAQKNLESVDTDGPRERLEGAQEEVEAAQKRLQALRSDELEQLLKEFLRKGIREGSFAAGKRNLGMAERDLEHLSALLKVD